MRTLFYLIIITFAFAINAKDKVPVSYKDKVNDYMTRLDRGVFTSHRSGRDSIPRIDNAYFSSALADYDDVNGEGESQEYQITYADEGFKPLFEKITTEKNTKNQFYDSSNNVLTFFPSIDKSFSVATHYCIDSTKDQAFLEAVALKTVDQFLPEFRGKIEFDRTDVTRQNGTYILSIEVFFHRLFKNRIVFPATSFISVSLNGKGDVTSIKVKWPKFKYATTCSPFAFGKIKNMVNDNISDTTPAIKGDRKIHSNNATVTGLAKGWHELPNGIMAPCFSFQVDYLMENREHRTEFIDMPTFPKYWPQGY